MTKIQRLLLALICLIISSHSWAEPMRDNHELDELFDDGLASFEVADYKEAYQIWRLLAEQGSSAAQYYLGMLCANGWGTKKNRVKAVHWYRMAAAQNHTLAQYALANALLNGQGVGQDEIEAFRWFLSAAKAGDAHSQFAVGLMYLNGRGGLQKDYQQAITWFTTASTREHVISMIKLGDIYLKGKGVTQNIPEALSFYQQAAAKGNVYAIRRITALSTHKDCYAQAKTLLFNQLIKCTTRAEFRTAIRTAGLPAITENNQEDTDTYDSAKRLPGSKTFTVTYTKNKQFAIATYQFPSLANRYNQASGQDDVQQISQLLSLLETKYGTADSAIGHAGRSTTQFEWQLSDGIALILRQVTVYNSIYLEYIDPENFKQIQQPENAPLRRLINEQEESPSFVF